MDIFQNLRYDGVTYHIPFHRNHLYNHHCCHTQNQQKCTHYFGTGIHAPYIAPEHLHWKQTIVRPAYFIALIYNHGAKISNTKMSKNPKTLLEFSDYR